MSETELYHPLIIRRNKEPLFYNQDHDGIQLLAYNPVCGDEYHIVVTIIDQQIDRITFKGYGCAVSKSAIDLLLDQVQNRTIDDAKEAIEFYLRVIDMEEPPDEEKYPLAVFQKVKYHPARKECAILGANSLLSFLNEHQKHDND
ncbi:MAG: iron-sulfur cluster assembly scaffold protein [Saprospiraceae bacterium]|nr:iron-sulfur cluster assembly scaffold protein [Saprospiraceae bacterium]